MPMKPIPYFGNYYLFTITYDKATRKGTRRQMTDSIMFTKVIVNSE